MSDFSIHPNTKLGPISLTVPNVARARQFYADTLGLRTLPHRENTVVVGTDVEMPLVSLAENSNARPKPARTTGLYHLAILLPSRGDLARVLRRLAENRYPLQGAADHGVSEALYLADPDGNGIEIYRDRPHDEWPWQEDRLQMVTDPLDMEGLLALSDGSSDGLPAATSIGHVHLHVADLDQAEHFYGNVLGFELMQRYGSSAIFLSAGGYHHHIGLNVWAGVGAPAPPPDAVGLRFFTVYLPDGEELARVAERLQAVDVPLERLEGGANAPGAFVVRDPSGNGILMDVPERR
jgi:catechol 2,3-dioxygenase